MCTWLVPRGSCDGNVCLVGLYSEVGPAILSAGMVRVHVYTSVCPVPSLLRWDSSRTRSPRFQPLASQARQAASQQNNLKAFRNGNGAKCFFVHWNLVHGLPPPPAQKAVRLHRGTDELSAKLQRARTQYSDSSRAFATGYRTSCLLLTLNPREASTWRHKLHHLRDSVY